MAGGGGEEATPAEVVVPPEPVKLPRGWKQAKPIKIILLGDSAVGKSKLVERYLMDGFQPQQISTFALTLFPHVVERDGHRIQVDFWDTAGQERFLSVHQAYYAGAHCCIFVFDVKRRATYKNLERWYSELAAVRAGIPLLVAANKIDLDPEVVSSSYSFATRRGLPLYYVSASAGTNVVAMFEHAIDAGLRCLVEPPPDLNDDLTDMLREMGEEDKDKEKSGGAAPPAAAAGAR